MTARAFVHGLASLAAALSCAAAGAPSMAVAQGAAPQPSAAPLQSEGAKLSPRAQRLFDDAVAALEDQRKAKVPTDWELLERKWRTVATEEVPEGWFNVGVALERQGKPAEARQAYERALALRPTFAEAAVNLAFLQGAGQPPEDAARTYEEVLRRVPEDPLARVRLADLYRQSGQLDEAWRLAREALQRDPRAGGALVVMMRVALAKGDLDLAELVAVRARKIDPADPDVSVLLGAVRERRGDTAGALAQYRTASAQSPRDLQPRYRLLAMALSARAWESAAEQARAILSVKGDDARVRLALGVALRNLGKPEEALAEYRRARAAAATGLPEIELASGVAHMRGKGGCVAAIPELEKYLAAVGPSAGAATPAPGLLRECNQILESQRQAEEAARQMKGADPKGPARTEGPAAAPAGAPPPPR